MHAKGLNFMTLLVYRGLPIAGWSAWPSRPFVYLGYSWVLYVNGGLLWVLRCYLTKLRLAGRLEAW